MNPGKQALFAAISGIAFSAVVSTARADFTLDSQSMVIDSKNQTFDFSFTFNQAPDFTTINATGQPVNSFQIDFAGDYLPNSSTSFSNELTSVVRGDEIHFASDLPIRSANGNGGPNSGGWGPIVDSVPLSLIGDTVSFSVPGSALGWTGHNYKYQVFSLSSGSQTASQYVTMVPTPPAFTSGLVGLIVVAGMTFEMRRRSRSAHRTG